MTVPAGLRIGVDGFNLAMPRGTGVATYARTLVEALTALGRRVDLVYGQPVARAAPPALRETLFHAALAEGRSGGEYPVSITPAGRLRRALLSPPRTLIEVPASGRVLETARDGRLPAFDRLFTLGRLFYLGDRYLRRYGRLLPVRVSQPPVIMHWTYPVPVRMIGTRNVYTIHDCVPLRLPFLSLEDKAYHERLLRQCVAGAAHLVTVSETSRRDLCDCLNAPRHRQRRRAAGRGWRRGRWQVAVATYMMAGQVDGAMSLLGIAEALDMSLGHFIKAFANSVGSTPYQWFQKQRIERALELLSGSNLSLAEISATCGFADQSHFTRCFTRAMGRGPGSWRRDPLRRRVEHQADTSSSASRPPLSLD